jgi:predicted dehydrogenase
VARNRFSRGRWSDAFIRAVSKLECAGGTIALRPLKVGVIGAGNVIWAYFQAMDRLAPRGLATIGPVCARRRESWPRLQSRRPGIELVSDPLAVLDSDADFILIITPPESHADFVREALVRRKHVVVEKPAATTFAEAQELARLAREHSLYLLCAPFVHLAPTFRALYERIRNGAIGTVHSARGLYGNAGSTWARWYHDGSIGPLAEIGIYNLKSLTAVLGPVAEVQAAEATALGQREIEGERVSTSSSDVSHIILQHEGGALSSVVSSHAIQRYRRPALEFYGTEGTANLLGDDWDPKGFEIWKNSAARWEEYEAIDPMWLWTDGIAELVTALREGRAPVHCIEQDLHLLEVIEACGQSAREKRVVAVQSRFPVLDLQMTEREDRHHLHDHTRRADEQ